jgi:hypothetical protein
MEGVQHNTYDVEFYGPNPLTGVWYLAALRAAEEMARAVGDDEFASRCRRLFKQGSAWMDEHLFNGEFYVQQIRTPASVEETLPELRVGMGETDLADLEYQMGNGCLVDQLVGQYAAHVAGLGHLLEPEQVRTALRSLFRYNYRSELYDHWNVMRTFALADESALLICTWPHGDRPKVPFPYFGEVMTGFEYQAAVHMIYEGLVDEGVTVIDAIRARFDGRRRNPWNEQECGHHYARAMASWAALLALSGFRYSGVRQRLELAPRWRPESFRCLWTAPPGWGMVKQTMSGAEQVVRWEATQGNLAVRELLCGTFGGATLRRVRVDLGGRSIPLEAYRGEGRVEISLREPVLLCPGHDLNVRLELEAEPD